MRNAKYLLLLVVTVLQWTCLSLFPASTRGETPDHCASCHTDKDRMDELTAEIIAAQAASEDQDIVPGYRMEKVPFDRYELTLVDKAFLDTAHGRKPCTFCHGGNPAADDPKEAHAGMTIRPSAIEPGRICGECHQETVQASRSRHLQPVGLTRALAARCSKDQWQKLADKALAEQQCNACHKGGSCGDCHVGYPAQAGGGLRQGHLFRKKPDFVYQCLSCHSAPVGDDFGGKFSRGDVHYVSGRMTCTDCHGAGELHDVATPGVSRLHQAGGRHCADCHQNLASGPIRHHKLHEGKVSCVVCHAQTYEHCGACHMNRNADGNKSVEISPGRRAIKIGRIPADKAGKSSIYGLVRSVPVRPDSFGDYLDGGLAAFDAQPTFKQTVPHNMQRRTWQTATCNHCHGRPELFLTEKDVPAELRQANKSVMVPTAAIPKTIAGIPPLPAAVKPAAAEQVSVSAPWLAQNLSRQDVIIVDTRSQSAYDEGHIPGAINLCYCHVRTKPTPGQPYFLKSPEELANLFGETLGLRSDAQVIVYGDGTKPETGLVFLAMERIGHSNVAFLEGQFHTWKTAGLPIEQGSKTKPEKQEYKASSHDLLLTSAQIRERSDKGTLLVIDARSPLEYMGNTKNKQVRTIGRIPGAINLPLRALADEQGRLLPPEQLDWFLAQYHLRPDMETQIVTSCNTGALAAELYMILRSRGYRKVMVHDGAWLAWGK